MGGRHCIERDLGSETLQGGGCRAAMLVHQFLNPDAPEEMLGFAGLHGPLIAAGHRRCLGWPVGVTRYSFMHQYSLGSSMVVTLRSHSVMM